jgi:tripartite-type tricarboxylate transporter receptor subunit TctC
MLTDTVNGSLDMLFDTYLGSRPMLETGKLKIIASTFDKRTATKYNHESIHNYSKKIGKMPLGIILSANPQASKEAKNMVINAIFECNRDSTVLQKLDATGSGPVFLSTEEIRQIVKYNISK